MLCVCPDLFLSLNWFLAKHYIVLPDPPYICCYNIIMISLLTKIFINSFSNLGAYPQNAQIELGCLSDQWTTRVLNSDENNLLTENLLATLTTPLRKNCSFCLSPERTLSTTDLHHCVSTYIPYEIDTYYNVLVFQHTQVAMRSVVQKV